jgi:hypothetical protein
MGHQGAQAPCLKYVRFAYNYAYPRIYIPKIHIPKIPNIYLPRLRIYTHFLHTQGIYAKKHHT